jgi:hypothetical protein
MRKAKRKRQYAVYQGDNFIDLGTAPYLARLLGIKAGTIQWQASISGRKRAKPEGQHIIRIPFDDEDDET